MAVEELEVVSSKSVNVQFLFDCSKVLVTNIYQGLFKYAPQCKKKKEMWFCPRAVKHYWGRNTYSRHSESLGPAAVGEWRPACQRPRTPMKRQCRGARGGRGQPEDIVKQMDFPVLSRDQLPQCTEFSVDSVF